MKQDTFETLNQKQESKDVIRYGIQLQMLNKLRASGAISAVEYDKVLNTLKRDYHVVSNLI